MAILEWKLSLVLLLIVHVAQQAPLDPKPAEEDQDQEEGEGAAGEEILNIAEGDGLADLGLEYEGYLREVIQVLEADPEMKSHMDEMDTNDLLTGKFGKQLNNVGSHIRGQLDELKKKEIQRLRVIARRAMEQQALGKAKPADQKFLDNLIGHLDPSSMESFSPDDITKLIQKATKDLEENDRERRKEFKRYEMEKELKRRSEMRRMNEEERAEARKNYEAERKEMKQHAKLNHPGSKKQLEEVWENTDHLDRKDFNPKTFFYLHDSNSDGFLDEFELEALFIKEAAKIYGYDASKEEELMEEIARMREHVMDEIDNNKDKMVSLAEFMEAAAASDFEEDSEWQDLNQESQFTEGDLERYQEELRRTLEETKAKMAEAGDNFVRVRQPQGKQDAINMNQAQAQQIKDGISAGLPDLKEGNDKIRFEGDTQPVTRHDPPGNIAAANQQPPQPPAGQPQQPPAGQPQQPPAGQPPQPPASDQQQQQENQPPPPPEQPAQQP